MLCQESDTQAAANWMTLGHADPGTGGVSAIISSKVILPPPPPSGKEEYPFVA